MLTKNQMNDITRILEVEGITDHSVSEHGAHAAINNYRGSPTRSSIEIFVHLRFGSMAVDLCLPSGSALTTQDALVIAEQLIFAARVAARLQAVIK